MRLLQVPIFSTVVEARTLHSSYSDTSFEPHGMLLLRPREEADVIAEKPETAGGEPLGVERWTDALDELHARVARRFRRPEVGERARRYLAGLLGRTECKNGWQMPEVWARPAHKASSAF